MRTILRQVIIPDDKERSIQRLLGVLAEMRRASLSEAMLRIECRSLSAFELVDLQAMVEHYRQNPRAEGETAFPESAQLYAVTKRCRGARLEAEKARREREEYDLMVKERDERRALEKPIEDLIRDAVPKVIGERAYESRRRERDMCPQCALHDAMSPDELRQLADLRERKRRRVTNSSKFDPKEFLEQQQKQAQAEFLRKVQHGGSSESGTEASEGTVDVAG